MKTSTIAVRVDAELKEDLESLFRSLGMTLSEAVSVFLHKAALTRGIPFAIGQPAPNASTLQALLEPRETLNAYNTFEEYQRAMNTLAERANEDD